MSQSYYETAQVCLNGHVITMQYESSIEFRSKHCGYCGESTIVECSNCNTKIRGHYHVPGIIGFYTEAVSSYCHECGKAYPWTEAKIEAARELTEELEELTEEERELLKKSLDDLVKDNPRTVVATSRFKRLVSKATPEIATGFKDILVDVVSETAKKAIWG